MSSYVDFDLQQGCTNEGDIQWDEWLEPLAWELDWVASDDVAQDRFPSAPPQDEIDNVGLQSFRDPRLLGSPIVTADRPPHENITQGSHSPATGKYAPPPHLQGPRGKNRMGRMSIRRFQCPHATCTTKQTFQRQSVLDRHIATQHTGNKCYVCPLEGCFKGTQRTAFARADKLTQHLRTTHRNLQGLPCPAEECGGGLIDRDLLWAHVHKAHSDIWGGLNDSVAAVANAASPKLTECPWWQCRKIVPLQKFADHVLGHTQEELIQMADFLRTLGYGWIDSYKLAIICLMCSGSLPSHTHFAQHVDDTHCVAPEQRDHWLAWRTYAQTIGAFHRSEKFGAVKRWEARKRVDLQCPGCSWSERAIYSSLISHHLSMLAIPETLRPYRVQILKLYPGFIDYPVWDDLKKPLSPSPAHVVSGYIDGSGVWTNDGTDAQAGPSTST